MIDTITSTRSGAEAFEAARAQFDNDIMTINDVSSEIDPRTKLDCWDEGYQEPTTVFMVTINDVREYFRTEYNALLYCWAHGFTIRNASKNHLSSGVGITLFDGARRSIATIVEIPKEYALI